MALFSQTDIEQWGFGYADFKEAGTTMTATQWATYCTFIVDSITAAFNRFCNVQSLETHQVTEYKDGKGETGDDGTYLDTDRCFYLLENSTGIIGVYEDETDSEMEAWTTRDVRCATATGDYKVITDRELTWVRFHDNYPIEGVNNVKIIYYGGYAAGSQELDDIKAIALRAAKNLLTYKKKAQEAVTIRSQGTRDFAPMYEPIDEHKILTSDVRRDLYKYRRLSFGGFR